MFSALITEAHKSQNIFCYPSWTAIIVSTAITFCPCISHSCSIFYSAAFPSMTYLEWVNQKIFSLLKNRNILRWCKEIYRHGWRQRKSYYVLIAEKHSGILGRQRWLINESSDIRCCCFPNLSPSLSHAAISNLPSHSSSCYWNTCQSCTVINFICVTVVHRTRSV